MDRIAVVFGTTDGQTAKVARYVASVLERAGLEVNLIDTRGPLPTAPVEGVQGAVLLASVRMGKFQRPLIGFVRQERGALAKVPTLFLPVSLSASRNSPAAEREVRKTIVRFIEETGFQPGSIQPVAGALVYSRYPFFTRLAMVLISRMAGGDTDTSRDYEYTDWKAVAACAERFAARVQGPRVAGEPAPAGFRADAAP